jgi:hypothetical protein
MREQIEHPEIGWITRTGYPSHMQPPSEVYCEECGKDITDEVWYEDECHEFLCESCLLYFHRKD